MGYRPNNLGTLKLSLHTFLNSSVELTRFSVELAHQLVLEVDEPVLLLRVPVLVVVVVVVKVHWQFLDFLVNSELSWL